jgi:hypothetical protein
MKPTQSKKTTARSPQRKSATSKDPGSSKKPLSAGAGGRPADKPTVPKPATVSASPVKPVASTEPELVASGAHHEILEEIRALRAVVTTSGSAARAGADADDDLESAVDSMRRLLSEFLERRTDQFLEELAAVRNEIARPARGEAAEALRRIDGLLDRWGASSFSASKLDYVDPAIHEVVAERNVPGMPDGVVVETLRPGMRGGGGRLLCKAQVAVNWKGAHEPVGH